MDDYLAKPLRPDVLATTLERWAQVIQPMQSTGALAPDGRSHQPFSTRALDTRGIELTPSAR